MDNDVVPQTTETYVITTIATLSDREVSSDYSRTSLEALEVARSHVTSYHQAVASKLSFDMVAKP
jgi:hypothetical protein